MFYYYKSLKRECFVLRVPISVIVSVYLVKRPLLNFLNQFLYSPSSFFFYSHQNQDQWRMQAPSNNSPRFYNWWTTTLNSSPCSLIVTCSQRIPDCFRFFPSMRTIGTRSVMSITLEVILNNLLILGLLFVGMFIYFRLLSMFFIWQLFKGPLESSRWERLKIRIVKVSKRF